VQTNGGKASPCLVREFSLTVRDFLRLRGILTTVGRRAETGQLVFSMDATVLSLRAIAPNFTPAGDASLDVRFRKTFEAVAIGIGICDLQGRIVEANSALARLLGYERAELVGIDPWTLGESESEQTDLAGAASSNVSGTEELLRRERESCVLERRCRRRDGQEFWGRLTVSAAQGDHSQATFLVVMLEDASNRRRIEEHLRQAEKMAALGQLAGGVAHDFNNLLTGILLYCDLLIPELELGGALHRHVEEIRLATEQGAALTQQLLALARKDGCGEHAVEVNDVAEVMENLLRRLIGEQIELITALDPAAGTVAADAAQLRQILLNLVLNARDALGGGKVGGGKIRVSTRRVEQPRKMMGAKEPRPVHSAKKTPAQAEHRRGTQHRQQLLVLLTVEDNGCGMSPETRAHLFEPFFTTKKAGEGTGIGLGTVRRIVDELGGRVEIASAAGSGTRVAVFLPVASHHVSARNF
jgi:two-component system, cell cycle sensor histidine kinase and response regulator CckA